MTAPAKPADLTATAPRTDLDGIATHLRRVARLPLERGETLPPQAYTSPQWYERELERIFRRDWLCVARSDEVARPGDYLRVDVAGSPLVITRDEHGALHALSRVCRHRFMDVLPPETTPERGNLLRLTCPYHTWTYRLSGEYAGHLAGAPVMNGVDFGPADRAACRLPAARVSEWLGFVMVCLDPDAAPLEPQLAGLDERLAPYRLQEWRTVAVETWQDVPANWKVAVENGSENYHHMGTHAQTLEPVLPGRTTVLDECEGRWFTMFTPFAQAPEAQPPQGMLLAGLFPQSVVAVLPDSAVWARWLPTGPRSHTARFGLLVPPGTELSEEELARARESLQVIQGEDLVALRGVQRGLDARPAPSSGRFSHLERPLWQFQRYLATWML